MLPARIQPFRSADLDLLFASGELIWRGVEPLGARDGRVALYLADHYRLLAPPPAPAQGQLAARAREILRARGASFFADLLTATGAFANDLVAALWELVWAGELTNDTLAPLRSYLSGPPQEGRRARREERLLSGFRPRRSGPPGSEGRWSLLPAAAGTMAERGAALAQVLLARYGVLAREAVHAEGIAGGFSAVYPVLKAMEEAGRARRGYFVAGLGATQFALPGAEERLRALREPERGAAAAVLAATDPANPYGAALPRPARSARPARRWCCTRAGFWERCCAERTSSSPSCRPRSRSGRAPPAPSATRSRRWSTRGAARRSWWRASTGRRPAARRWGRSSPPPASRRAARGT